MSLSAKIQAKIDEVIKNFYHDNPYVQHIGLDLHHIEEGTVTLKLTVEKRHTNFYEIAHGGLVMSMLDTAMGAASLSVNKKIVTQSLTTNFIRGPKVGTEIFATGKVIHNGRRTVVSEAVLREGEDGRILATASGSFFVLGLLLED